MSQWKETTRYERNRIIFAAEFDSFLPDAILDFHVHVFPCGVVPAGDSFSCSGHPIERYDLDELNCDLLETYPRRKVSAVCFGFPSPDYDLKENNDYLAERCDRERFFPLRLFDPCNDLADRVAEDLHSKRFLGLKPYPDYVRKSDVNTVDIPEMLPAWAMDIANECGAIIMLHIPRKARLADPLNQRRIIELCRNYPRCKIVLAHIGRAYFLKNILGNLEMLKDLPNLYYDLTMVNHWEVMEYLFQTVAPHKILYGTDIPLALAPGKSVEINDQYTYVTPVPWELSITDNHGKLQFTSFLYEELRAVKKAIGRLGLGDDFVEKLFFRNGMALIQSVSA